MSAVGQHSGGGSVSQASDGFDSAQPQWAIVRAVAPGWVEMTGFGYLELLGLTAPEIVVSLAGIAVLVLDLSFLRRLPLAFRFRWAVLAACSGCVLALIVLDQVSVQGSLAAGMLVVSPLTQLLQIAL